MSTMTLKNLCRLGLALPLLCPSLAAAKDPFGFRYFFQSYESDPTAAVTVGRNGMIYGTTYAQNGTGYGTVYAYNTVTKKETTLHTFQVADGVYPYAGVTFDGNRNKLYGVTQTGGSGGPLGHLGTLYSIDLTSGAYKVLFQFNQKVPGPGANPAQTLVLDKAGRYLYGTTEAVYENGTIFRFDLAASKLTTLYTFTGGLDGLDTYASTFVWDATGTILYGTSFDGGEYGSGDLFAFDTTTNTVTPLHQFNGASAGFAGGYGLLTEGLSIDANGVLYGTTLYGGLATSDNPGGNGTIYTYDTKSNKFTTIYTFPGDAGGADPWSGITLDAAGNLWGTTCGGGKPRLNSGLVYEYVPSVGKPHIVYKFNGFDPKSGECPYAKLTLDNTSGRLYGTTRANVFSYGSFFEVATK